jgi:hypothetical protein
MCGRIRISNTQTSVAREYVILWALAAVNEHADLVLAVRVAKLKGGDAYAELAEELRAVLG